MVDLKRADVVVCVGTPPRQGELAAYISYVTAAVVSLAEVHVDPALIAGKSSVPIGTAVRLADLLADLLAETKPRSRGGLEPGVPARGPRRGRHLHPDRLVFGVVSDTAEILMRAVYARPIAAGTPVVGTDHATAEMVKAAAYAFLVTEISFINAMAEVCEAAGADVVTHAAAIGHDDRIGHRFLRVCVGFGGGLPKDIRAFMARAGELGADQALTFLREVDNINMRRRSKVVELAYGGSFMGHKITVLCARSSRTATISATRPPSTSPHRRAYRAPTSS